MVVKQEFEKLGVIPDDVNMGEVELKNNLTNSQLKIISNKLTDLGFEILDDKNQKLIEKIKNLLIEKVQSGDLEEHFSITEFLTKRLNKEYTQAYTFFPLIVSIVQLLPSPNSTSSFPGSQAYIFPFLFQTVWGSLLLRVNPPPSIGHPFKAQLPIPSFCACPKVNPPSVD
jgi:hypothetical protein